MNKKIFKTAIVSVCAACAVFSAVSLTACNKGGGDYNTISYYNKTITFTGKAYSFGFDSVGLVDNYNYGKGNNDDSGERNTTQRRILEKYWDEIDWDYTGIDPAPKNADKVKKFFDLAQENVFKDWKDLSITITKTDTVSITLTLPEKLNLGWEDSVTMTLYENDEEYTASTGLEPSFSGLKEGHFGAGVKVDGNKRLKVKVWTERPSVNKGGKNNVNMDTVYLSIQSELIDGNGSTNFIDTGMSGSGSIYAKEVKLDEFSSSRESILSIYFYPEVTITDVQ